MSDNPRKDSGISSIESEDELQEWITDGLEGHGWNVIREVSPDHSNYRVDLLLIHPHFGRIGVETKYVAAGEGGLKIARAHEQITRQYWNKKYWGDKVLLWAICPYFERAHLEDPDRYNNTKSGERTQFTREFFCHYGIGFLEPSWRYNIIDFGYSMSERKVPGFPVQGEIPHRHYESVDIEAIRETVREKRGVDFR